MNQIKDAATEPQARQKRLLPPPDRLPLGPPPITDQAPIAALLQSIANEISQSDQRQGNALADLRARLNLLTERQPSTEPVAGPAEPAPAQSALIVEANKPRLAIEDRRVSREAMTAKLPPRAPFRETSEMANPQRRSEDAPAIRLPAPVPQIETAVPPAVAKTPSSPLADIYASVAHSYAEAVQGKSSSSPKAAAAAPVAAKAPTEPMADDDNDFLDMSALADAYAPPRPARAPVKPTPAPAPAVAAPVSAQPTAVRPLAASPVVEASLAVEKSIGDLAERISQTERKIDQALRQPADSPALAAITTHVEALRGDLDRLSTEHEKVSEAVGQVSANVSALSHSAAQIGPMSDTLGHLNEAILSLRQDLPGIAEQTAERTSSRVNAVLAERDLSAMGQPAGQNGSNPELAEKLAIVQNLLLSRAVEQRETETRSIGALESIRGLVQNLHHRIDAMESDDGLSAEAPVAAVTAQAPAGRTPSGPRVVHAAPLAAVAEPEFAAAQTQPVSPQSGSPQSMSREDLIASARRAAMAASQQQQPMAAVEPPRASSTTELRNIAAAAQVPAGIFERLGSRSIVMFGMVVLLAAGLGMVYAKVIRKAPPKVQIEQTALPEMPADLPDAASIAKPVKPAAAKPATVAPVAPPAEKSSALAPEDLPAANASTLAAAAPMAGTASAVDRDGDGVVETASTVSIAAESDTLPAAIAPLSQRTAALAGDPAAAYLIADRYLKGTGVERDSGKAAHWFEQSALAGSAQAEFKLGVLHEKGDDGISPDAASALDWYSRSAKHGNVQAMHNLAVLYTAQSAAAPDYAQAAKWFEQAANFGLKDSQYNLAVLYANGLGVKKDAGSAYKWFSIAASHGDAEAAKQRDAIAKSLSASMRTDVEAQFKAWHAKPVDRMANSADPSMASLGQAAPAIVAAKDPAVLAAMEVGKVQKMLVQLGYDPGTLDGTMTAQTHEAIKTFEDRSGMPVTGELSPALLQKLKGLAS